MQFLAAIIVGVIAILMAMFFIPQIQDSLNLSVSTSTAQSPQVSVTNSPVGTVKGTSTVRDILADIRSFPEASTFVALFNQSGVESQLIATGTYTFFVPTDDAFARSPLGPIVLMGAEEKARLAQYHIVSDKMVSISDVKAGNVVTLSRDQLNANIFDDPSVDSNTHVVATYRASNGIIYVIDHVLLPPQRRPFPF